MWLLAIHVPLILKVRGLFFYAAISRGFSRTMLRTIEGSKILGPIEKPQEIVDVSLAGEVGMGANSDKGTDTLVL